MKPEIPETLATSALVQWRPGFDGNSPILHYQLQYRKSGDKDWCVFADKMKETLAIVEDLESDSAYRFRVSATNEVGSSAMSEMTDYISTPKVLSKIFYFCWDLRLTKGWQHTIKIVRKKFKVHLLSFIMACLLFP